MQNYKYTFNFNVDNYYKEKLEKWEKEFYKNNTSSNSSPTTYIKMNGDRYTFNFNVDDYTKKKLEKWEKEFYQ